MSGYFIGSNWSNIRDSALYSIQTINQFRSSSSGSPPSSSSLLSSTPFDSFLPDWQSVSTPVKVLVGAHILIYLAYLNPRFQHFIETHFACSVDGLLKYRRFYTIFTSTLFHSSFLHLAFNTIGLLSISVPITNILSNTEFLSFYASAALISCLINNLMIFAASKRLRRPEFCLFPQMGASGAVFALAMLGANLYPDMKFGVLFIPIQLDGVTLLSLVALYETWGIHRSVNTGLRGVGHGAHLGGILFGWLMYQYLSRYNKKISTFVKWQKWKQSRKPKQNGIFG